MPTIIPSNGVFIAPHLVLTAWHILEHAMEHAGSNPVKFANDLDQTAAIDPAHLPGTFHDAAKDLAIVELDRPIGLGCHLEPLTSATLEKDIPEDTLLVAEFQGQVWINLALENQNLTREFRSSGLISDDFSGFATDAIIQPGFSGAPIVNNQDRVISILSSKPQPKEGFEETGNIRPFFAPSPRALAEFIDQFMEEILGLD